MNYKSPTKRPQENLDSGRVGGQQRTLHNRTFMTYTYSFTRTAEAKSLQWDKHVARMRQTGNIENFTKKTSWKTEKEMGE